MDKESMDKISKILTKEFMSSEESDYEEKMDENGQTKRKKIGFIVKELPWQRTKLRKLKSKLDDIHLKSLSPQAQAMTLKRVCGEPSNRAPPTGPAWAVRSNEI